MAPLGVLTAIVGAIRVGGASWLKRLIGRARENNADWELELISSVSQVVCEVWNGKSIVRSIGDPKIKQIIHLPAEEGDISPESFITMEPCTQTKGYTLNEKENKANGREVEIPCERSRPKLQEQSSDESTVGVSGNAVLSKTDSDADIESRHFEEIIRSTEQTQLPPNISLNVHGMSDPVDVIGYAVVATLLQSAVLAWSGFVAYSGYAKGRSQLAGSKPLIGFWLQIAGTLCLTISLILCASIIDNGSSERHWLRGERPQRGAMSQLSKSARISSPAKASGPGSPKIVSSGETHNPEVNRTHHQDMQLY